jgi:hypothetical protein
MAIMAKTVASPLQELARQIFVQGVEPWTALTRAFGGHGRGPVLLHTPVCIVMKEKTGSSTKVIARCLAYSHPLGHPWGVTFSRCGTPTGQCMCLPGDLRWKAEHGKKRHEFLKLRCVRCGWKSAGWIQRPSWIHAFEQDALEHFFWTEFPLTAQQKSYLQSPTQV